MAQLYDDGRPGAGQEQDLCLYQHRRPGDRPRRLPDAPALRSLRTQLRLLAPKRREHLPGADRLCAAGQRRRPQPANVLLRRGPGDRTRFPAGRAAGLSAPQHRHRDPRRPGARGARRGDGRRPLLRRLRLPARPWRPAHRARPAGFGGALGKRGASPVRRGQSGRRNSDRRRQRPQRRSPRRRGDARSAAQLAHAPSDADPLRTGDLLRG